MNSNAPQSQTASVDAQQRETYTPGFALPKLLLMLAGLVLLGLSLEGFGPLLRLAVAGRATWGESTRVEVVENGQTISLTSDAEIRDLVEQHRKDRNREAVFWPELRFTTADGQRVTVRKPIGYRIPLGNQANAFVPLRDSDGLPTREWVWYDHRQPTHIVLPLLFSTWFVSSMLALFGFLATGMGYLLWRNAQRPIVVPDLSATVMEDPQTLARGGGH
jgi:hypothetical protein